MVVETPKDDYGLYTVARTMKDSTGKKRIVVYVVAKSRVVGSEIIGNTSLHVSSCINWRHSVNVEQQAYIESNLS